MKISIIVPLFNKIELTRLFEATLNKYAPKCDWEVIWVDDGSIDGTREWLKTLENSHYQVMFNEKNKGYAISNNRAALMASGTILILLNNDTTLQAASLDLIVESLIIQNNVGVVGNIQIKSNSNIIDHAGVCYDLIGRPDHYLKGRCFPATRGNGSFATAVTAACCAIRRDLFLSVGGFDESFRNGCEDVDLCLRLGQMGYRHWVDYRSVIYHHVSASPGRKDHENQNLALFLKRWGHLTLKWGQEDWPKNYLSRHLHCLSKLNGTKTVDALLRLAGLRHGDSKWAAEARERIIKGGLESSR